MASFVVALPIVAGKEEPWRRFAQELMGSRLREYEGFRERIGLDGESVWLACPHGRETAVVHLETDDAARLLRRLTKSEHPFDVWLKEKLAEFHGCDLVSEDGPELIFAFPPLRDESRISGVFRAI